MVLFGGDGAPGHRLALHQLRQAGAVLGILVVAPFVIDGEEAVEGDDLPGGAQFHLPVGAGEVGGRPLHPG